MGSKLHFVKTYGFSIWEVGYLLSAASINEGGIFGSHYLVQKCRVAMGINVGASVYDLSEGQGLPASSSKVHPKGGFFFPRQPATLFAHFIFKATYGEGGTAFPYRGCQECHTVLLG